MPYLLRFDGVNDRVDGNASTAVIPANTLTVEIDFALPVVAQNDTKMYRIGNSSGSPIILIGPQSDGRLRTFVISGGVATIFTPVLVANTRYTYRLVFDSVAGTLSAFLNGAPITPVSIPSYNRLNIGTLRSIGSQDTGSGFCRMDLYGLKEFVNGVQISNYDNDASQPGSTLVDTIGTANGTLVNFTLPAAWVFYSSGATYQLTALGGTFSYAGAQASLLRRFRLQTFGATYAYSGASANLTYVPSGTVYTLTALGGSFAYSGGSANVRANRKLIAQGGNYSYSGGQASLLRRFRLVANGGAYSYAGGSANLTYNQLPGIYRLTALGATYTYTGGIATLTAIGVTPMANPGAYVIQAYVGGVQTISAKIGGRQTINAMVAI